LRGLIRGREEQAVLDWEALVQAAANGASVRPDQAEKVLDASGHTLEDLQGEVDRIQRRRGLRELMRKGKEGEPKLAALQQALRRLDADLERDIQAARAKHAQATAAVHQQMPPLEATINTGQVAAREFPTLAHPRFAGMLDDLAEQQARLKNRLGAI